MAWYDSISGLTATNAWDAIGHTEHGALAAKVGAIDCGGSWGIAAVNGDTLGCQGSSFNQYYSSAITLPDNYTIAYLLTLKNTTTEFLYSGSPVGELWINSSRFLISRNGTNTSSSLGSVPSNSLVFLALTRDSVAGTVRAYINGAWGGGTQSDSYAPRAATMIGYDTSYSVRLNEMLHAHAIFDSAASLTQLQDMEAAVRAEMQVGMFVYQSGSWVRALGVTVQTA